MLDPLSRFYKQLQTLLLPEPELQAQSQSSAFLPPAPTSPKSAVLDLQCVIDAAAESQETPERSPSPQPQSMKLDFNPSHLTKHLYVPSGKWDWMKDQKITDESSRFLSAGAVCSAFYRKGRAAGRDIEYICKSWHGLLWKAFFSELALYKKQLRPLQGICVPHVIGVFAAPAVINVVMEPPHHSFWIEASTDMPLSLKQRCVDAISQIHSCGVLHGDIELRHMLIGGDARVTIIDFQESTALEPNEELFLFPATEAEQRMEMRKAKVKLDYPGSRLYEKEKRERCLKRKRLNDAEIQKSLSLPGYKPQLEEAPEDDILNPPVLKIKEWNDWLVARSVPQVFIVPGQSFEQRKNAYHAFLNALDPSPTLSDPVSEPADEKLSAGPSFAHAQVQTERDMQLTDNEDTFAHPVKVPSVQSRPTQFPSPIDMDIRQKQKALSLEDVFPRSTLDPFPSVSAHDLSLPTGSFERLNILRDLAEFPAQVPGDILPSIARDLLNQETARVNRVSLTRKRASPFDSHTSERPIKRSRLDDGSEELLSSLPITTAGTSQNSLCLADLIPDSSPSEWNTGNSEFFAPSPFETKPLGLGAYAWLPNLRYPSAPVGRASEQRTWAQIAMKSLGTCALQELPHPDLIKLFPHHPRWAEADVQVFLGRLHRRENELAMAALRHPDKRVMGPRHPRSLGNLKRTLSEIQHNLEHTSPDVLIREPDSMRLKPVERDDAHASSESAVLGPDTDSRKQPNQLSRPYDAPLGHDGPLPRKVRFHEDITAFSPPPSPIASSDAVEMPHTTESESQPWYQKPFNLLTQVFTGYSGLY
ncbi:hypothetical protein F5880DRAFT_1612476 [Lentinula raphanica]|nr:hypothetical protein F5880DRAFT_1612476 [Lentinula raphanica]